MNISEQMLVMLAMDSYNRGYDAQIGESNSPEGNEDGLGEGGSIGNAPDGKIRIIDNTKIGKFLFHVTDLEVISEYVDVVDDQSIAKRAFAIASEEFVKATKTPIITITPNAEGESVFAEKEVRATLESDAPTVNGRPIDEIKADLDKIPDPEAQKAYLKALYSGDFSRIVAQGEENKLRFDADRNGVALDIDQPTLARLGAGEVNLSAPEAGLTGELNNEDLNRHLSESRARASEAVSTALAKGDDPDIDWKTISDPTTEGISGRTSLIAKAIQAAELSGENAVKLLDDSLSTIWRAAIKISESASDLGESIVKDLARWQKSFIDAIPSIFDGLPEPLVGAGKKILRYYAEAWDDTVGLFKFDGSVAKFSLKITVLPPYNWPSYKGEGQLRLLKILNHIKVALL